MADYTIKDFLNETVNSGKYSPEDQAAILREAYPMLTGDTNHTSRDEDQRRVIEDNFLAKILGTDQHRRSSGLGSDIVETAKSIPRAGLSAAEGMLTTPMPVQGALGIEQGIQRNVLQPIGEVAGKLSRNVKAIQPSPLYSPGPNMGAEWEAGRMGGAAGTFGHMLVANSGPTIAALGASLLGGPEVGASIMGTQIFGDSFAQLKSEGIDENTARKAAFANAIGQMPLEYVGISGMLSPQLLTKTLGLGLGRAAGTGVGAASEGLTEFTQKLPEAVSYEWARAKGSTPTEKWTNAYEALKEKYPQYINEAIVEGLMGVATGGPLTALNVMTSKDYKKNPVDLTGNKPAATAPSKADAIRQALTRTPVVPGTTESTVTSPATVPGTTSETASLVEMQPGTAAIGEALATGAPTQGLSTPPQSNLSQLAQAGRDRMATQQAAQAQPDMLNTAIGSEQAAPGMPMEDQGLSQPAPTPAPKVYGIPATTPNQRMITEPVQFTGTRPTGEVDVKGKEVTQPHTVSLVPVTSREVPIGTVAMEVSDPKLWDDAIQERLLGQREGLSVKGKNPAYKGMQDALNMLETITENDPVALDDISNEIRNTGRILLQGPEVNALRIALGAGFKETMAAPQVPIQEVADETATGTELEVVTPTEVTGKRADILAEAQGRTTTSEKALKTPSKRLSKKKVEVEPTPVESVTEETVAPQTKRPTKRSPKLDKIDQEIAELAKKINEKFGSTLSSGIDPEIMGLATRLVSLYSQKGIIKLADITREVVAVIGEKILPYMKSAYNSVRDMTDNTEMESYEEVRAQDINELAKPVKKAVESTKEVEAPKSKRIPKLSERVAIEQVEEVEPSDDQLLQTAASVIEYDQQYAGEIPTGMTGASPTINIPKKPASLYKSVKEYVRESANVLFLKRFKKVRPFATLFIPIKGVVKSPLQFTIVASGPNRPIVNGVERKANHFTLVWSGLETISTNLSKVGINLEQSFNNRDDAVAAGEKILNELYSQINGLVTSPEYKLSKLERAGHSYYMTFANAVTKPAEVTVESVVPADDVGGTSAEDTGAFEIEQRIYKEALTTPVFKIFFDSRTKQWKIQRKDTGERTAIYTVNTLPDGTVVKRVADVAKWLKNQVENYGETVLNPAKFDDTVARLQQAQVQELTEVASTEPSYAETVVKEEQEFAQRDAKTKYDSALAVAKSKLKALTSVVIKQKAAVVDRTRGLNNEIAAAEKSLADATTDFRLTLNPIYQREYEGEGTEFAFGPDVRPEVLAKAWEEIKDSEGVLPSEEVKLITAQSRIDKAVRELTAKRNELNELTRSVERDKATVLEEQLNQAQKAEQAGDYIQALSFLESAPTVTREVATVEPATAEVHRRNVDRKVAQERRAAKVAKANKDFAKQFESSDLPGTISFVQKAHTFWAKVKAKLMGDSLVYSDDTHAVVERILKNGEHKLVVYYLRNRGDIVELRTKVPAHLKNFMERFSDYYFQENADISPFEAGDTVTISQNVENKFKLSTGKLQDYVTSVMDVLGMKDMQVAIVLDDEIGGLAGLENGFFGRYKQFMQENSPTKYGRGATVHKLPGTTGKYVIKVNPKSSASRAMRDIFHEFGHIVFQEGLQSAPAEVQEAIKADYLRFHSGINRKLKQDSKRTLDGGTSVLAGTPTEIITELGYEAGNFKEWFANRVRDYAFNIQTTGKQPQSLIEQFFSKLVQNIKDFVNSVSKAMEALGLTSDYNRNVNSYLDTLSTQPLEATFEGEMMETAGPTAMPVEEAFDQDDTGALLDEIESELEQSRNAQEAIAKLEQAAGPMLQSKGNEQSMFVKKFMTHWAQAYWLAKEFAHKRMSDGIDKVYGKTGFKAVYDAYAESLRNGHRRLHKSLTGVTNVLKLKDEVRLQELSDITYLLDEHAAKVLETLPEDIKRWEFEGTEISDETGAVTETQWRMTPVSEEFYTWLRTRLDNLGISQDAELLDYYLSIRRTLDQSLIDSFNTSMDQFQGKDRTNFVDTIRKQVGQLGMYFPHSRVGTHFVEVYETTPGKDGAGKSTKRTLYRAHYTPTKLNPGKPDWIVKEIEALKDKKDINWANVETRSELVEDAELYDMLSTPVSFSAMEKLIESAANKTPDLEENSAFLRALKTEVARKTTASGSWRNNFTRRQYIPGYDKTSKEFKGVLYNYLHRTNAGINKLELSGEVLKIFRDENFKPQNHATEWKYADQFMSDIYKTAPQWVSTLKQVAYVKYLGLRISSATVNLMQNYTVGIQRLGMDVGIANSGGLFDASYRQLTDKLSRKLGKGTVYSQEELDFIDDLIDSHQAEDQMNRMLQGEAKDTPTGRIISKSITATGYFLAKAEKFNRITLGLAAFKAARQGKITNERVLNAFNSKLGQPLSIDQAKEFASQIISDSHWDYNKGNIPEIMRQYPWLQTLYIFKSFPLNMAFLIRHLALNEGARGKVTAAAMITAMSLLGGLKGIPGEGEADKILKSLGIDYKHNFRKLMADMGNQDFADVVTNGTPVLLGADFTGNLALGLGGTNKIDPNQSIKANMALFLLGELGIPLSLALDMGDATSAALKGDGWKAAEKFLPAGVAAPMRAWKGHSEGMKTGRYEDINYPGKKGPYKFSAKEAGLKAFGFQPRDATKLYDMSSDAYFQQGRKRNVSDELRVALRVYKETGGRKGLSYNEAMKKVAKYNEGKEGDARIKWSQLRASVNSPRKSRREQGMEAVSNLYNEGDE